MHIRSIEEYFFHDVIQRNGLLVNYFTAFEEAGVDIVIEAIWSHTIDGQSLSDLMGMDKHRPNPCPRDDSWWVFKACAELSGTRVGVTRPDDATTAFAAKHVKTGSAKILLGHSGGKPVDVTLVLKNQPFAGGSVRVDNYRIVQTENDGLQLQSSATPRSTRHIETRITMAPEDVWLVVVKKQASSPVSFCLKAPHGGVVSGGTLGVGGNSRVHRNLDAPIGGLLDAGMTYTISVDLALSREWTAFEAHKGGRYQPRDRSRGPRQPRTRHRQGHHRFRRRGRRQELLDQDMLRRAPRRSEHCRAVHQRCPAGRGSRYRHRLHVRPRRLRRVPRARASAGGQPCDCPGLALYRPLDAPHCEADADAPGWLRA